MNTNDVTLKEYLESIEGEDLKQVSRDIFARNVGKLARYLPKEKIGDLATALYQEFENLPMVLIKKVLKYKEEVLVTELQQPVPNLTIVRSVIRFSSDYDLPLQSPVIITAINNDKLPKEIRFSFATYLANWNLPVEILEDSFIKAPFILPALLTRLRRAGMIFKALRYLDAYFEEADMIYLRPRTADLLNKLLATETDSPQPFVSLNKFLGQCKPQTASLINDILSSKGYEGIKARLEYVRDQPDSTFQPEELLDADGVLSRVVDGMDIAEYPVLNPMALAFSLARILATSNREKIKRLTPVFLAYDNEIGRKFHLCLYKYNISYDPSKCIVDFKDESFKLSVNRKQFEQQQMDIAAGNQSVTRGERLLQMASHEEH